MNKIFIFSLLTVFFSLAAQANSVISLNALNYPVWVERNQQKIPLAPGAELLDDDIINTGEQGRAWLSMLDGSVVKLGQNSQFKINSASFTEQSDNNVLEATLQVIKGAFRFTSGFFRSRFTSSHQLDIKIGTFTAGIRGTDIWGRSNDEEDFVTLLEGNIQVQAENEPAVMLDQPLSLYLKKRGLAAEPVTTIDMSLVEKLGAETELSTLQGIANTQGEYDLIVMSLTDDELAQINFARFEAAGYAIQLEQVVINEDVFKRLLLRGFVDRVAADHLSERLVDEFQLQSVWVKKHSF